MRNKRILYAVGLFGNGYFERAIFMLYLLSINFTLLQVGILQALLNLTMFLAEIPTGIMSDKIGRKFSLMLGHTCVALYMTLFLFFDSFWILAIGHILFGLGLSFISGTDEAYLYDCLDEEGNKSLYGSVIGKYNAIVIIALALAMGVGGLLQTFDWSYVFLAGLICQLIAIFCVTMLKEIKARQDSEEGEGSSFIEDLKQFFKINRRFKFLIVGMSTFYAITSVFILFSQEIFHSAGLLVLHIGLIYASVSIIQAVLSVYAHKFEQRFSAQKTLVTSFIVIGLFYTLITSNHIAMVLIAFVAISSIYELVDPLSSKVINEEIPQKIRATMLSLISLLTSLIMFIAFPLIGVLSDYIDSYIIVTIMGVISMFISLTMILLFYKSPSQNKPVARGVKEV